MWNGMHFEPENGRDVIKIYHQQVHFTNVLCRDKRKSYSPWDEVMHGQVLDPRITRKFKVPPPMGNLQARRVHKPLAVSNWRQADADKKDDTTPTHPQLEKKGDTRPQANFKTPTPTHQRTMKRDHVPTPLQLRKGAGQALQSPSPRPGQIIKCIVDENGNFIPITPFEGAAGAHSPIPDVISGQNPAPFDQMLGFGQEQTASPVHPYTNTHMETGKGWKNGGTTDAIKGNNQEQYTDQPPKSSLPRLSHDVGGGNFAPPHRTLRHAKTSEDLACDGKKPQVHGAPSSEWSKNSDFPSEFRRVKQEDLPSSSSGFTSLPYSLEFPKMPEWYNRPRPTDMLANSPVPSEFQAGAGFADMQGGRPDATFRMPPSVHTAPGADDTWAAQKPAFARAQTQGQAYTLVDSASNPYAQPDTHANHTKMDPEQLISHWAQEQNQGFIRYDADRLRAMRNNANISAASTLHPEYLDWASTSDVERRRIQPFSPTSAGDPFTAQSVSKAATPTSKAFAASVNRELRTMRQGQRASPTPRRIASYAPSLNEERPSTAFRTRESSSSGHATAASADNVDGGVRIQQNANQPSIGGKKNENGFGTFKPLSTQDNAASPQELLPGLGQVPRNLFPAFVAAGQTTSGSANDIGSTSHQSTPQANTPGYGQQDATAAQFNAWTANTDSEFGDSQSRDDSDLIRFNS